MHSFLFLKLKEWSSIYCQFFQYLHICVCSCCFCILNLCILLTFFCLFFLFCHYRLRLSNFQWIQRQIRGEGLSSLPSRRKMLSRKFWKRNITTSVEPRTQMEKKALWVSSVTSTLNLLINVINCCSYFDIVLFVYTYHQCNVRLYNVHMIFRVYLF